MTSPAIVDKIIDAAVHRVPVLESASILTTWTGVRPLTPDGRPILGFAPGVGGLLLNCGWGGVGIIQAPMAGLLAAEVARNGRATTMDIEPLSLRVLEGRAEKRGLGRRGSERNKVDLYCTTRYSRPNASSATASMAHTAKANSNPATISGQRFAFIWDAKSRAGLVVPPSACR